jgi:2-deoxystreptamine N-acetyl-D-glucosaminyltransferase/2-deoxystreptamine glucosyltransferase
MRGVRTSAQLRLFVEQGHDVRAVVPAASAPFRRMPPREEHDGAVVVTHPRYPWIPHALGGPGTLFERRWFARAAADDLGGADVVVAHSALLPGGILGRLGGAVFVVTLHDHEMFELAPRSVLVRRALRQTLLGANCAVYVSAALHRAGVALAGEHRARVIPIGIDTFADLTASPPDRFTISCVARLVPRKRIDRLIRAFSRLSAIRPEARLVIVGDGPERPLLERLVEDLHQQARVEFTGALDRRRTVERIARSSVMALPSVLESLGAVYLEAMALGVPALGTDGEGISEHMEHGVDGILVPADDDEALYVELSALAADPERCRQLGEAGRTRFEQTGPTWAANVASHLDLFEELSRARARGIL